ncbi:MAG: 50S ribosomal protein L23 [Bacteroidota bacterium]|nr:50S ribosomal protein L23 [Bacteroidota bacterium]
MNIIKKPLITEKYSALSETENKFGFIVDKKADKEQIKKEIEQLFKVKVLKVRTMIYQGKEKSRHTKRSILLGRTKGFKKAVVTLKQGDSIDFYSNI